MRAHYISDNQKHVFETMMRRCLEERPTARGTFEDVLEDTKALLKKYKKNNQTETLEGNTVRLYIQSMCFQCICARQFSSTLITIVICMHSFFIL